MDGHHDPVVPAPAASGASYLRIRPVTPAVNSSMNAARSAAEAKRTSPSSAYVASRLRAFVAPVISEPTSRTRRAPSARSQRAESWSRKRSGSGCTAARASGEITYDAAVARISRSVTLPLRRSPASSTRPCRSSAFRW